MDSPQHCEIVAVKWLLRMQQSVGGETEEMAYVELAKGKILRVIKSEKSVAYGTMTPSNG